MRCSQWAAIVPQKWTSWLIGGISSVLLISSSAVGQQAQSGFRAYELRHAHPAVVEQSLRGFLDDSSVYGEPVDVVADARGKRVLVRGSQETLRLAAQFVQAIDQPERGLEPPVIRTYSAGSVADMKSRAERLQKQYAERPDVKIVFDDRTRQLIVQAPLSVHESLGLNATSPATPSAPAADRPNPFVEVGESSRREMRLQHIPWQELVRGLQSVVGSHAALAGSTDGQQLEMTLRSNQQSAVALQIDQRTNDLLLTGERKAAEDWVKVIEALDTPRATADEQSRVVSLDKAQPASITRAISLASGKLGGQAAAAEANQGRGAAVRPRWAGDIVTQMFADGSDGQVTEIVRDGVRLAQAPGQAAAQLGNQAADAAGEVDALGSFLGPVRIEFLEGLDMIIVKGQKRDVDRVLAIINDIERLSQETQPKIEVYLLEHANSEAIGTLVTQLNESILTARYGEVSVTALVKPNAILLIGRPETVDSTIELIKKLDKEVEPSTQFKVFPLKHTPSVDVERTIANLFIAERTGLATRVTVVADFRTNAAIAYGSPRDLEELAKLIDQIDVPSSATASEVKVFKLKNALAEELLEVLNTTLRTAAAQQQTGGFQQQQQLGGTGGANTQPRSSPRAAALTMLTLDAEQKRILETGILTDVTVAADTRANSLVVTAPSGSMDLITELIRQLDQLPTAEAQIKVFTVQRGDANSLVTMLESLFSQTQQAQGGPAVQTAGGESSLIPLRFSLDQRTNSIIASGSANDLDVVYAILTSLDASDVSARKSTVYRLENSPADEVATAISTFLQSTRDVLTQVGQQTGAQTFTPFEQIEREVVVVPELNSNSLIISATERFYDEIIRLVKEIDRRPELVMIQVLIAEVTLGNNEELGVELGIQDSLLFDRSVVSTDMTGGSSLNPGFNFNNNQPLGSSSSASSLATREKAAGQALSSFALGRSNSQLGYGGLVLSASSESINVLVRALQASNRIDILSRPQVMTMNNQTAFVQVGQLVPQIQSATFSTFGQINNVQNIQVGLILQVTPRVTPDGLVVMNITASKSDLGDIDQGIPVSVSNTGQVVRSPIINITQAQTVVSAQDGQTVILGGLITKNRQSSERKIPYLGDVPVLGRLFRYDSISETRTELLIIMTPKVIRSQEDIAALNSEEYARMSWCMADAIEVHGDLGSYSHAASIMPTEAPAHDDAMPLDETLPSTSTPTMSSPKGTSPASGSPSSTPGTPSLGSPGSGEILPSPSSGSRLQPSSSGFQEIDSAADEQQEEATIALAPPKNRAAALLPGFMKRRTSVWDLPPHEETSTKVAAVATGTKKPGVAVRDGVRRFDEIPDSSSDSAVTSR